jgi:hypothetical protein
MTKFLATLAALAVLQSAAMAQVYVNGYTRSNGTQVQGYYRTAPDSNPYNNYSTRGNVNPYTGQQGTVNPNSGASDPAVYNNPVNSFFRQSQGYQMQNGQ